MGSLTSTQHDILVGSLLGDGTLRKQGTRTNALLEVNHTFKQKEYVDWKWKHFQEFVLTPPRSKPGKGDRVAYRFTTRSLPEFTSYHNWFYVNGKKIVPDDINLTPLTMAVWVMDDGTRCRNSIFLNTQQFENEDQYRLQHLLHRDMGIESVLAKDKEYQRLYINTISSKKLSDLIRPYILSCFNYKLIMTP